MAKVVLVHGAWHGAWCWDRVVAQLDAMGVAHDAVELPLTGLADDVAAARDAIATAGPGSVVVAHSYGGIVVSQAASSGAELSRLVFVAAYLPDAGVDPAEVLARSALARCIQPIDGGTAVDPARAHEAFYGDSDAATVAEIVPRLRVMAIGDGATAAPPPEPAWKTVPSTYVVCTNDAALPPDAQRIMAAHTTDVVEWPTDHSPFLTRPRDLAALVASYL